MADKKMMIIATKGTLDWAYPPFILASTAAALGMEVQIFFTFYGLQLLRKNLNLKVSSLGNPACRCQWAWTSGSR
jgi:peroxiredoxin family protein